MSLPKSILDYCNALFSSSILKVTPISGGDINEAFLLRCSSENYFLKYNTGKIAADMFQKEAQGLALLRKASLFHIPDVIKTATVGNYSFLILEYISPENKTLDFWEGFAKALAQLHQIKADKFGLDHDNYIGKLPQSNRRRDNWIDFFVEERLGFQLKMGIDKQLIPTTMIRSFQNLYSQLIDLLPQEKPSLIHGDLWSGNYLVGQNQRAVLIDPAVYFGHREMDLAMSMLFGGFDTRFYEAYHHFYPLEKGFEARFEIYQLYYLLVHVNLFGKHYLNQVQQILTKY